MIFFSRKNEKGKKEKGKKEKRKKARKKYIYPKITNMENIYIYIHNSLVWKND